MSEVMGTRTMREAMSAAFERVAEAQAEGERHQRERNEKGWEAARFAFSQFLKALRVVDPDVVLVEHRPHGSTELHAPLITWQIDDDTRVATTAGRGGSPFDLVMQKRCSDVHSEACSEWVGCGVIFGVKDNITWAREAEVREQNTLWWLGNALAATAEDKQCRACEATMRAARGEELAEAAPRTPTDAEWALIDALSAFAGAEAYHVVSRMVES